MKAILSNQTTITDLDADNYFNITRPLTFANPKHQEALKFGRSVRKIDAFITLYENIPGGVIIPRGIALEGLELETVDDQRHVHPVCLATNIELRDYQARTIEQVLQYEQGVIVAPTGAGKTTMAIALAARLGQRSLIVVKSLDLAKQWQAAIQQFTGLVCGRIGGGQKTEGEVFTVALVQSLVKEPASLDYGLVIVDECHNIPANQAFAVINRQAAKYRYGLSATPQRRDNLEFMIHAALGPVIAEVKADELAGSVLPVTVFPIEYEFKGHPESWVEFTQEIEADPARNRLLIQQAIQASSDIATVVLTSTIYHAETLHQLIQQQGIQSVLLHGQLTAKERDARMNAAQSAQLIVGTLSLLGEGIDWPHIGAIVFAAPVSASVDKSNPAATRLIQSIGRARRPYPGKTQAMVFDVIDNHPFGRSVYNKRKQIYDINGFLVQSPDRSFLTDYAKEE